jgi:hypothetical protein
MGVGVDAGVGLVCWCGCLEPSHLSKSGEKLITLDMH